MKRKLHILIVSLVAVIGLLQPVYLYAATPADTCAQLKAQFTNANAEDLAKGFPQYCSTGQVYNKIVNILYGLIGAVAVIAIIIGGYFYMTAAGNAVQAKKGLDIIKWALIGVVVVVLAVVIVQVVSSAIVDNTIF